MNLRLKRLERIMRPQGAADLWIDMHDNRARVDVGLKRGEEKTFPSVFACAAYVEEEICKAEVVCGLCFVSDVMELIKEKPFTYIEDLEVNKTAMLVNLAMVPQGTFKARGYEGCLTDLILFNWAQSHAEIGWRMFEPEGVPPGLTTLHEE